MPQASFVCLACDSLSTSLVDSIVWKALPSLVTLEADCSANGIKKKKWTPQHLFLPSPPPISEPSWNHSPSSCALHGRYKYILWSSIRPLEGWKLKPVTVLWNPRHNNYKIFSSTTYCSSRSRSIDQDGNVSRWWGTCWACSWETTSQWVLPSRNFPKPWSNLY